MQTDDTVGAINDDLRFLIACFGEVLDEIGESDLARWLPWQEPGSPPRPADADPDLMREYAALVEDQAVRERIMGMIEQEYDRTRSVLEQLYGGPLAERRPNVQRPLSVRQDALRTLHAQQIALLRRWRAERQAGSDQAEPLMLDLLVTVNAIAGGLGTTG